MARKKKNKPLTTAVRKLIEEQKRDMLNQEFIDNEIDSSKTDIYSRRKRTRGSGFSKK